MSDEPNPNCCSAEPPQLEGKTIYVIGFHQFSERELRQYHAVMTNTIARIDREREILTAATRLASKVLTA